MEQQTEISTQQNTQLNQEVPQSSSIQPLKFPLIIKFIVFYTIIFVGLDSARIPGLMISGLILLVTGWNSPLPFLAILLILYVVIIFASIKLWKLEKIGWVLTLLIIFFSTYSYIKSPWVVFVALKRIISGDLISFGFLTFYFIDSLKLIVNITVIIILFKHKRLFFQQKTTGIK